MTALLFYYIIKKETEQLQIQQYLHGYRKTVIELRCKKKDILFIAGVISILAGVSILAVFGWKRISREIEKQKLLKECVVFEIPALDIKTPVIDGTDHEVLSAAAGHFPDTGAVGSGNYCIAGHNSTIYAEIFNDMKHVEMGMEMYLIDNDEARTKYIYTVTENFVAVPSETWVLDDFGDDRITIVTCTDDGTHRQIVVGKLVEK